MKHLIVIVLAISAIAAQADTCPDAAPDPSTRQALLEDLSSSKDPMAGQQASQKLWAFWMTAPDDKAQSLLNTGMSRRSEYALEDAEIILDGLISYCPNFPEGWNQRAFVRYLRQDFEGSIADIDMTLSLEPSHFGALSGKALALLGLGKVGLAKLAVVRAIEVHPWLSERSLLGDGEEI